MVLGNGLVDADGNRHAMLGLLGLETSFAARKLHLGYRQVTANGGFALGAAKAPASAPTNSTMRASYRRWASRCSPCQADGGTVGLAQR